MCAVLWLVSNLAIATRTLSRISININININNPPSLSYHYHRRAVAPASAPAAAHMAQMANGSSAPHSLPATALRLATAPQQAATPVTATSHSRQRSQQQPGRSLQPSSRIAQPRAVVRSSASDAHTQSPYRALLGRGPRHRARDGGAVDCGAVAGGVPTVWEVRKQVWKQDAPLCGCGRVDRSTRTPKRNSQMHLPVVY